MTVGFCQPSPESFQYTKSSENAPAMEMFPTINTYNKVNTPIDVCVVVLISHEPLFRSRVVVSNVGVYALVITFKVETIHPGVGRLEMELWAPFEEVGIIGSGG
jgi:hypothetical protein